MVHCTKNTNSKKAATRGRSRKNNTANPRVRVFNNSNYTLPQAMLTVSQPGKTTSSTRQVGNDLLLIKDTGANTIYSMGSIVAQGVITAQTSARLEQLSRAYQRIRWHRLTFTIQASYSSLSGGGFIACFVKDPTDQPPHEPNAALQWAMAQQDCVDSKWWDNTRMVVTNMPDLKYTSLEDNAPRFYSPGTLFIISKGGPAQAGSITVTFSWDVTLSEPTLEASDDKPISLIKFGSPVTLPWNLADNNAMTLAFDISDGYDPAARILVPAKASDFGLTEGEFVRFPSNRPITCMYNTGQDYVPLYLSGAVVHADNFQIVFETVKRRFVAGYGEFTVPAGYAAAPYHELSIGNGALVGSHEELVVERGYDPLVGSQEAEGLLTFYKGAVARIVHGRLVPMVAREAIPDEKAYVSLSGERLPLW